MKCPLCGFKLSEIDILELISNEKGEINCPNCGEIITKRDMEKI